MVRRDYTPGVHGDRGATSDMPGRPVVYGEAEGYRRFVADEVFPFIASHYRADMAHKVFAGHSYVHISERISTLAAMARPDSLPATSCPNKRAATSPHKSSLSPCCHPTGRLSSMHKICNRPVVVGRREAVTGTRVAREVRNWQADQVSNREPCRPSRRINQARLSPSPVTSHRY